MRQHGLKRLLKTVLMVIKFMINEEMSNEERKKQIADNEALHITAVMHWVDAEIEIPVVYAPVLVCFKEEWVNAIRTAYWCGDSWIVNGNKPILTDKITYWMNLPNPPCA